MTPYPHHYLASASGTPAGAVAIASPGLPGIDTAPPPEFDGPGGVWSPETLLAGAVADCFILTFRGVSRAAEYPWQRIHCEVEATLERAGGVTRFTRYLTRATLHVAAGSDVEKARALLERAEKVCLVSNSLSGERAIECHVVGA